MTNIITHLRDISYLRRNFISNAVIAARADAAIVRMDSIKKQERLRRKNNSEYFLLSENLLNVKCISAVCFFRFFKSFKTI